MERILIVDDEPMIRKGLTTLLQQYSASVKSVRAANNGEQALAMIREECPDVVFTDIRMPIMDGLELCRALRAEFPFIPVVVISGYNDFSYAQQCIHFGVREYMIKPVDRKDVYQVMSRLSGQSDKQSFSLVRYNEIMDDIEQAIWTLNHNRLTIGLSDLREHCNSTVHTVKQHQRFLAETFELLIKKLQARDFIPYVTYQDESAPSTLAALLSTFESYVEILFQELQMMRSGVYRDPIEEVLVYIQGHLSEDIHLEQMAEIVGLTPSYFSYLFKKKTNDTFVQYRTSKRMELAKKLLCNPQYKILDVCLDVGYKDYPHFTKTFKKMTGYSPSEYRSIMGIK
ncbi:response regulator [Paenibacillaceae bacterium]|nr:response regulator [Paenibacillaceae bacterium]